MARKPLRPLIRSGGFYPSKKWTPLVYAGGYTTANGGEEPAPPPIEKTVTGNPIHILDALAKPAQALSVKLEPIQDLHGYDNPWPAGGGDNLLDLDKASYNSLAYGLTVARDGDGVRITGTATQSGNLSFNLIVDYSGETLGGKGYILQVFDVTSGYTVGAVWGFRTESERAFAISLTGITSGQTVNCFMRLSVSLTSQTAWTPYSNLCPISGHTDADVTRTGKNLIPTPVAANAIKYNGSGLSVADVTNGVAVTGQANGSSHSVGFILLDADYFIGKTLTFSLAMVGSNSLPRAAVMYCDANCTNRSVVQVLNDTGSITFTVPSTAKGKKIGLGLFSTSGQDSLSAVSTYTDIQLELGSTPSAYEEYRGTTYHIPLGTTVYGGTLDVLTGVLTVTMASVDLGTLTYTYMSLSGGRNAFIAHIDGIVPHASNDVPINAISSAYKAVSYNAPWTNGDMTYTRDANGTADKQQVTFINNDYTDAAAFKTAMAGQTLCYELATPTTIQLTPTQVELLQGENNIWSDGEMTLVYLADGNASDEEALNILLGGRYVNNHGEDEPTDREALQILLGGNR